jgi:diguanylate cyclase (GGDEF)-like protein
VSGKPAPGRAQPGPRAADDRGEAVNGPPPLSLIASLRVALEAARGVRTPDELSSALDRIAAVISETLGYATVAVNVHRAAWDDFQTASVHGSPAARATLVATTSTWEQWAPYLASRFERRGAHVVLAGTVEPPREDMTFYRAPGESTGDPAAWDPDDLLLVVMRRANGDVLGILSVDEPAGGRRPSDDDLDRLVAMAQIAALAMEQAQEAERDARHRGALERLLSVSSRIADQRSRGGVLDAVCAGIRDALGFDRVAVLLADDRSLLRPAATAGWSLDDPVFSRTMTLGQLKPILQPVHERHGCYLLEHDEAEGLLGLREPFYRSRSNGRGPYAWDRHWLLVPLRGADGAERGVVWADDPRDRLLPGRERLQALRLFSDQAAAALETAAEYEVASHRAAHDALTGLPNRATLAERLRHALQRVKRSQGNVAVLFVDLDRFKEVNDHLGHAAGDEVLRTVAARIDAGLRPGDTVARFGGDEFVVVCEDLGGADDALEVAERLRASLARPIPLASGKQAGITASIGVALPDRPDRTAEMLLQAADRAMYEVKASGRDATRLASPGAGWP